MSRKSTGVAGIYRIYAKEPLLRDAAFKSLFSGFVTRAVCLWVILLQIRSPRKQWS